MTTNISKAERMRAYRALKASAEPTPKDLARFWFYVDKPDGCWNFRLDIDRDGYGNIEWRGKRARAHRVAWELAGRELPVWPMVLDHICRNRACVNVDHLRAIHQNDNVQKYAERKPADSNFYRLTADKALEIRRRYQAGERPTDLAIEFGVSNAHICGIGKGKCWKRLATVNP